MEDYLTLMSVWAAAGACLVGLARWQGWRIKRQGMRAPASERLLRGPGESLRLKLENLEEQISETLTMAYMVPFVCTSIALIQSRHGSLSQSVVGATIVAIPVFASLCVRLVNLLQRRRRFRLGLSGERAVGEELNSLMLRGCRVFHDVPNDPYGNIDHVLVASAGVFAVETKARRKSATGRNAHRVAYDGRALRFGEGSAAEYGCLEQATHQASRLSDWLSKAVGEAVHVRPVLALPGWFVEYRGRGEVIVLSGKAVGSLVSGRSALNARLIERLAYQLDQRCRDIEF